MSEPWLVVIDTQRVFAREGSPWAAPRYAEAEPNIVRLADAFGERAVYTRWVAPEHPEGAWVEYFEQWPFALVPPTDRIYELMPEIATRAGTVITRTTFGKWDAELAGILGPEPTMLLAGVSTDCCVISTALAAADAGVRVRVVQDACAGASDDDHARALAAMALYAPLIELTTTDAVLGA